MHIRRVEIANIRAIERLELDLEAPSGQPRRRLILLGGNGSGKTTVLNAIAHLFAAETQDRAGVRLDAGDVRMRRPGELAGAGVGGDAEDSAGALALDVCLTPEERSQAVTDDDRGIAIAETFRLRTTIGGLPVEPTLRSILDFFARMEQEDLAGTDLKPDHPRASAGPLLRKIPTPACVLLPADRGTLGDFEDVRISEIDRFEPGRGCLDRDRSRFRLIPSLLALAFAAPRRNDPDGVIARMWKVMAKYFPEMPRPVDVHGLRMLFETPDGAVVSVSQLSDGQRALLLLMGELALRNPAHGVVLIDEVEQHLHPRWQRAILDALLSLLPGAQFILTSQAPYIAVSAPDDVVTIGDWGRDGPQ